MIRRRTLLLAIVAVGLSACLPAITSAGTPSFDHLREVRVEIASGGKTHVFRTWVADTPASRSRGLMFVSELPADRGMLFLYDFPQFASFWMRNTYIPLDLLFISPDWRIAHIVENTVPFSLTPLESTVPVMAVLELAGGTVSRLDISPGATLTFGPSPGPTTP